MASLRSRIARRHWSSVRWRTKLWNATVPRPRRLRQPVKRSRQRLVNAGDLFGHAPQHGAVGVGTVTDGEIVEARGRDLYAAVAMGARHADAAGGGTGEEVAAGHPAFDASRPFMGADAHPSLPVAGVATALHVVGD